MEEEPQWYYDRIFNLSPDKSLCHRVLLLTECQQVPPPTPQSKKEFLARLAYLFDSPGAQFQRIWDPETYEPLLIYEHGLLGLMKLYPGWLTHEHLCCLGALRLQESNMALPKSRFRVPTGDEIREWDPEGGPIERAVFRSLMQKHHSFTEALSDFLSPIGKLLLDKNPKVRFFLMERFSAFLE